MSLSASAIGLFSLLLAACAGGGPLLRHGFADGVAQVGKTYSIDAPRHLQYCDAPGHCTIKELGTFTVDNAGMTPQADIIRIVFDDGDATWISVEEFKSLQFTVPIHTRLVIAYGMTIDQVRSNWGEPTQKTPESCGNGPCERWIYPGIGSILFRKGTVSDIDLKTSLAAVQ